MADGFIQGLYFRKRNDNLFECHKKGGFLVVYGATAWGRMLAKEENLKIDYFCDRRADAIQDIEGIPVVDCNQLKDLIEESGKRATIFICVGFKKKIVLSIFNDLVKTGIDADVFDYFENEGVFSDRTFMFGGKVYTLYEHSFNCGYIDTRMTERSIELALAKEYLQVCLGKVVEIGAVTPYYFSDCKIVDVVDPTDQHINVNIRKSLFEYDLNGKNVLSISTVEHIGTHDYGMSEEKNVIDAIDKIIGEAESCLITAPLGYNRLLDEWIKDNRDNSMVRVMKRGINNHWKEISVYDFDEIVYGPLWANGLVIIRK